MYKLIEFHLDHKEISQPSPNYCKEKIKVLPCLHEFHSECVKRWLDDENICPECRKPCANILKKSMYCLLSDNNFRQKLETMPEIGQ